MLKIYLAHIIEQTDIFTIRIISYGDKLIYEIWREKSNFGSICSVGIVKMCKTNFNTF